MMLVETGMLSVQLYSFHPIILFIHSLETTIYVRNVNLNYPSLKKCKTLPGCHATVSDVVILVSVAVKYNVFPCGTVLRYALLL